MCIHVYTYIYIYIYIHMVHIRTPAGTLCARSSLVHVALLVKKGLHLSKGSRAVTWPRAKHRPIGFTCGVRPGGSRRGD